VQRAVRPESIAVGVFGLIAALACLVIALLVISRETQASDPDRQVLRALGASPRMTVLDSLVGILIAVVAGTLLACALAVAVSPIAPLGPIHTVFDRGVSFDWTVL